MFVEDEWVKQLAVVSLRYRLISIAINRSDSKQPGVGAFSNPLIWKVQKLELVGYTGDERRSRPNPPRCRCSHTPLSRCNTPHFL